MNSDNRSVASNTLQELSLGIIRGFLQARMFNYNFYHKCIDVSTVFIGALATAQTVQKSSVRAFASVFSERRLHVIVHHGLQHLARPKWTPGYCRGIPATVLLQSSGCPALSVLHQRNDNADDRT